MKILFQNQTKFIYLLISLLVIAASTGLLALLQNPPVPNKPNSPQVNFVSYTPTPSPSPSLKPLPDKKILLGGYQTFQTFNNCGPASLSMALSYFGIQKSQAELGLQLRPYQVAGGDNDDKSVTLPELAAVAKVLGLNAYHSPSGNFEIITNFINYDIPIIVRTWTKTNEDIGHYRVIKGYDLATDEIIQDDSLQGKDLGYSREEFNLLWEKFNYEFLVLVPPDKDSIATAILGDLTNKESAWQKSVQISKEQLTTDPGNIYARFNLSVANYHLGNYAESIEEFEKVEALLPFRTLWYQIEPILAYQKVGYYDRAISIIDKVIGNYNRAYTEGYKIKSEIYEAQGKFDLAQAELAKVYQYNKNFYKYWD